MDLRIVYEALAELMFPKPTLIPCGSEPARDSQDQRSNQASHQPCGEGACPRWAAKRPQMLQLGCIR
jgi:hypothetical protein